MTVAPTREAIFCDCCGKVVMGYRLSDAIVWFDNRHGVKHTVKVALAAVPLDNGSNICKDTSSNN